MRNENFGVVIGAENEYFFEDGYEDHDIDVIIVFYDAYDDHYLTSLLYLWRRP